MSIFKKFLACFFKAPRLAMKKEESAKTGFIMDENLYTKSNFTVLNMFIRMLMVNCFALGTIDAFMSAFNIPYNAHYVFLVLSAISFVIMLAQFNLITRIAVYALVIWRISDYYINNITVIRSGLNAVSNLMYELVRLKFKLPTVDGFTEMVADRSVTIPTVVIIAGAYYLVILWESCGRTMNIVISGALSLAVISMGLYFDGIPSFVSMLMLSAAWLITACIKLNGKYPYSLSRHKQYKIYRWKDKHYYYRLLDGKAFAQFFAHMVMFFAICLGVSEQLVTQDMFNAAVPQTEEKEYSDFLLKDMMITAFSHYKKYTLQTRTSGGQLGQYSSVEIDNQPDLEVTFIPEKPGRQYLKHFVGTDYSDSMWTTNCSLSNKNMTYETAYAAKENNKPARRMRIKSLDIMNTALFLPYYTDIESNGKIEYFDDTVSDMMLSAYEPYEVMYYSEPDVTVDDAEYRKYVYEHYLSVPDINREPIEKLCAEKGFSPDDSELETKLADYFESEFKYSLNPGLVPWKTDFVNYFLFENKVGLCAHFASAGVLIYRTLGIPARYVEGYALDYMPGMYENEVVLENEAYSDWAEQGAYGITQHPVKIELTDISAHAWIEIYKDNYGWVPVELTPGADELETEKKQDETLGSKLMALILDSNNSTMTPQERAEAYKEVTADIVMIIIAAAVILILLLFLLKILKIILRHTRRLFVYSRRDAESVLEIYTYIMRVFEFTGKAANPSHKQMCELLSAYMRSPEIVTETVERILYSSEKPSDEECINAFISLHGALSNIFKYEGFIKTVKILLAL
ncbi:MAG: transglutaminase domain-containing protein [Firmicutes bacterium]|nr:transglutaminase domain-containing protein [Bacillota bacterium]MBQ9604437.1 transglutaminase domain-containing protein [Bacillota bacterium]